MKTKFGSIIVAGRGKLGGSIFSYGRGGSYEKAYAVPANTITPYRTAVRSSFAAISQGWRNLTESQRQSWITGVTEYMHTDIFGDLKRPSGYNLYMKVNSLRAIFSLAIQSSCVSPVSCTFQLNGSVFVELTASVFLFEVLFIKKGYDAFFLKITPGISQGISYYRKYRANIPLVSFDGIISYESESIFTDRFGRWPLATQSVFVELYAVNTSTGQSLLVTQVRKDGYD